MLPLEHARHAKETRYKYMRVKLKVIKLRVCVKDEISLVAYSGQNLKVA